MRVTMKDIAKYAGCSVTTVSLVLNNKARSIPEQTQKRVMEVVKELKYRPIIALEWSVCLEQVNGSQSEYIS